MAKHFFMALGVFTLALSAPADLTERQREDASDQWADAFAWLQTGHNLADLGQWPLAVASYSASLEMLQGVARTWPEYEPEVVAFRIDRLERTIEETGRKLQADEHDISLAFQDMIEMLEKGESIRVAEGDYEEAYEAIREAKSLLFEVIEKRPTRFRLAVAHQLERIEYNLDWLHEKLVQTPAGADFMVRIEHMVGTTEFVKVADLPEEPGSGISAALFP